MHLFAAVDFLSSAACRGGDYQRYRGDDRDEHNGCDGTYNEGHSSPIDGFLAQSPGMFYQASSGCDFLASFCPEILSTPHHRRHRWRYIQLNYWGFHIVATFKTLQRTMYTRVQLGSGVSQSYAAGCRMG
eukprot:CAMPEP_0194375752 /NCGR_PEP_ID=MMETSP0174-20130528/24317_1 /TAXON_ID=216777 /ORGANISM="Proboscia alata, Strain PI-D3" /LENGTH=129 /DNA_ID=CAMNT_0039156181 /DNA_START=59 /DNA_END=448 /DNA_ORIENTATION=+